MDRLNDSRHRTKELLTGNSHREDLGLLGDVLQHLIEVAFTWHLSQSDGAAQERLSASPGELQTKVYALVFCKRLLLHLGQIV